MPTLLTVKVAGVAVLLTTRSGESPISPKLLSIDCPPDGRTMPLIADGVVVTGVAVPVEVPSIVPGVVMPLRVSAGWVGSVTV